MPAAPQSPSISSSSSTNSQSPSISSNQNSKQRSLISSWGITLWEKYEDTIRECTKALELNPKYMKALVKRGEAYEKCEKLEEAIVDMKKILDNLKAVKDPNTGSYSISFQR
ncbi:hypothetical protein EZV62_027154 [Acer yangbiense]|uniref:Uncharacterized protein n=1 Tax=Acer yangbiense TaxID=1000413 RepID=A0A5C7GTH4_9ROSI|nr:hypothetical protein EZV62_027154 [Acer yangbiense]